MTLKAGTKTLSTNAKIRHDLVRQKVDEIYKEVRQKTGFNPDLEEVIKQVSTEVGYSVRYVKEILKDRQKAKP